MRRSTIIAIALIIAVGIPLIPLAVILWPSPQMQVPDKPQQSASIFLKGNEAIDEYFIGDSGDGLSWTTAYTLAYISVDGHYANSSIWIKNSTRYLIIKNCSVIHGGTEYNGGAGIIIENSTHVKIANTSIMYNGGWGILLNNSQECTVCDNTVKENGKDGIALRGSQNCSILQNSVSSSEIDGISLYDSTNCSIISNSPAINDEDGIYLRNSANCSIINNNASRNGNDGIHLYDSVNCSIAENEILNASKAGIELYHSNCSDIRNNTVDGLTIGIYLANSHTNNFVGNIMSGVGFSFQGLNNFTRIDSSNVVNGHPVFYYENKTKLNLAALTDVGQLVLVNCNDSSTRRPKSLTRSASFMLPLGVAPRMSI